MKIPKPRFEKETEDRKAFFEAVDSCKSMGSPACPSRLVEVHDVVEMSVAAQIDSILENTIGGSLYRLNGHYQGKNIK